MLDIFFFCVHTSFLTYIYIFVASSPLYEKARGTLTLILYTLIFSFIHTNILLQFIVQFILSESKELVTKGYFLTYTARNPTGYGPSRHVKILRLRILRVRAFVAERTIYI